MNRVYSFVQDVKDGTLPSNKWIKKAVARFEEDHNRKDIYFDQSAAQKALNLIGLLRHTKGAYKGQNFFLFDWQAFLIANIYGWKYQNGRRKYRKVYAQIARKNGKTELAAAIALIEMFFSEESTKTPEVYSAATKRDQAKIVFDAFASMVRQLKADSPAFNKVAEVYKYQVEKKDGGVFKPLSSDAHTLDGYSPSMAIIDEYHSHSSSEVLKVLETGQGSRLDPLMFIITTAGFNIGGACHVYYNVCTKILDGVIQDDNTFVMIFQLDPEDIETALTNEKTWIKANPCIGRTPSWEYMRSMSNSAQNEGATALSEFMCKNLNHWVSSQNVWISDEDYMSEPMAEKLNENLNGLECYAGLDLSSVRDVTSLVLFFPSLNLVKPFFWLPEERVQYRSNEGAPYIDFVQGDCGFMTTEGNAIDYRAIKKKIFEVSQQYNLKMLGYDRFNSSQLIIELLEEGIPAEPFGQGFISMNRPMKEIEKMISSKSLMHEGNPVLRWMFSNVTIQKDDNGNIRPSKKKSKEKIDGVVALAMALGVMLQDNYKNIGKKSLYSENDIKLI